MNKLYRQYLREGERAGTRYALQIPREAMRGATGAQIGHGAGSSLDFKDYRDYQPGDDLRRIDWGLLGRTDRLIVKMYREEVNPHLDIVIDGSGSMGLPDSAKARALLGMAAALATASANARCTHRAWMMGDGVVPVAGGTDRPSVWEAIALEAERTPERAFARLPPRWRRHGMRVFISDLLWVGDPLLALRPMVQDAAALVVVQLLAREDEEPSVQGNTRLVDVESGEPLEVFVDVVARNKYRHALARHQQNWHRACRQVGAAMVTVTAEEVTDRWRLDALEAIQLLGAA